MRNIGNDFNIFTGTLELSTVLIKKNWSKVGKDDEPRVGGQIGEDGD